MAVFDLYSKRKKKQLGSSNDVLQYDQLPKPLRVQICYLLNEGLGNQYDHHNYPNVSNAYQTLVEILCREYGTFALFEEDIYRQRNSYEELHNFILLEKNIDRVLDAVELTFRFIDRNAREYSYLYKSNCETIVNNCLVELNARFLEHSIGYSYNEGIIIKIDSEYIHSEIIKPVIQITNNKIFNGAFEEFIKAHEHYRSRNYSESCNECLKALESTLKIIATKKKWKFKETDTAKSLIELVINNELIPTFWESSLTNLRCILESTVPTGRNKLSGHGQGDTPREIKPEVASFMINMTASTILLLIKASKL